MNAQPNKLKSAFLSLTVPRTNAALAICGAIWDTFFENLLTCWSSCVRKRILESRVHNCLPRSSAPLVQQLKDIPFSISSWHFSSFHGQLLENIIILNQFAIFFVLWFGIAGGCSRVFQGTWFKRLSARTSTTVTSHTNSLPIYSFTRIYGYRLPSIRYTPRGSSIKGKSRNLNVCFMSELGLARQATRILGTSQTV